ncbi:SAM-dependent methyltransferase [Sphaerisporangium aureirubrum]|uniref:SAM-dependent methyltransferase n=1 Tax=Sphaerisporangium aureirubrum TaxID=1544736 RepID=A0ABW1NYI4_9ACTN
MGAARVGERGEDWDWATPATGQLPPEVDTTKPSIARVYDWFLGGKDNFAVDRHVAEMALQIAPGAPEAGRQNRLFLQRAVHHMAAEAGVRQFLDIGSGLPTQGNVHQVAQRVDPAARVVYVDNDPMVLAHGRALLATNGSTTVIQADAREPRSILDHPQVREFIDFSEPVGLLMLSILHHLNDEEDPAGVAATLRAPLTSGSFVAVSHFCNPGDAAPESAQQAATAEKVFNENLGTGRWRSNDEIKEYFGDFELLEPGLVPLAGWRIEPSPEVRGSVLYPTYVGGVARKA